MAFDLRIFFGGICAFVPRYPIEQVSRNRMRVLLTETDPDKTNDDLLAYPDRHYPQLWFDLESTTEWQNPPPYTEFGKFGIWPLEKEDISFLDELNPDARENLQTVAGHRDREHPKPCGSDLRTDHSWLAGMKEVDPTAAAVHDHCFCEDPGSLLASRIEICNGHFLVSRIWNNRGYDYVWQFRDESARPPSLTQALATWIEVRVPIRNNAVSILSNPFSGISEERRKLTLSARGQSEMIVFVTLLSGEVKDLKEKPCDDSFKWLYRLCARPPALKDMRIPHLVDPSPEKLVTTATTFCPGGGFDPDHRA